MADSPSTDGLSFKDLFTRLESNKPSRVEIEIRKNGKAQKVWIDVVGADSDQRVDWEEGIGQRFLELAKAQETLAKATTDAAKEKAKKEAKELERLLRAEEAACCVVAWSFAEPCTLENVTAWFAGCERARKAARNASNNDNRFFSGSPSDSSTGQSQSSDSTSEPTTTEPAQPSEKS